MIVVLVVLLHRAGYCAMTITDGGASSVVLDPGGQADSRSSLSRWRQSKRAVVGVLLGAVVLGTGWWWSHPNVYGDVGDEFGARPEALMSVYVAMVEEPDLGRVTIINAEPRVHVFGGEAQADVLLCNAARIGIVYGDDVESQCFPPGQQRDDASWDQVVLKVTPLGAGAVVVVDGIDLTYKTQFQRGSEHTGSTGAIVFPNE